MTDPTLTLLKEDLTLVEAELARCQREMRLRSAEFLSLKQRQTRLVEALRKKRCSANAAPSESWIG